MVVVLLLLLLLHAWQTNSASYSRTSKRHGPLNIFHSLPRWKQKTRLADRSVENVEEGRMQMRKNRYGEFVGEAETGTRTRQGSTEGQDRCFRWKISSGHETAMPWKLVGRRWFSIVSYSRPFSSLIHREKLVSSRWVHGFIFYQQIYKIQRLLTFDQPMPLVSFFPPLRVWNIFVKKICYSGTLQSKISR